MIRRLDGPIRAFVPLGWSQWYQRMRMRMNIGFLFLYEGLNLDCLIGFKLLWLWLDRELVWLHSGKINFEYIAQWSSYIGRGLQNYSTKWKWMELTYFFTFGKWKKIHYVPCDCTLYSFQNIFGNFKVFIDVKNTKIIVQKYFKACIPSNISKAIQKVQIWTNIQK